MVLLELEDVYLLMLDRLFPGGGTVKPRYRRVPYRPDEEEYVRTPEAGRRLEIRTREVFELIDEGVLRLAGDAKGHAWVPVADIEAYRQKRSA